MFQKKSYHETEQYQLFVQHKGILVSVALREHYVIPCKSYGLKYVDRCTFTCCSGTHIF